MKAANGMVRVLSAKGQKLADQGTVEEFGLPGFTLMESAGRGAAEHIWGTYGPLHGKRVAVYCGKGNNGGDGFVVARLLHERGAFVHVLAPASAATVDAAHNLRLLRSLASTSNRLRLGTYEDMHPADLYVDALLGTGVSSPVREPTLGLVARLNAAPGPVVALDLPTGLHPDYGTVLGSVVRADMTVTMGALKPGLLIGNGPNVAGRVEVVDIGIPTYISQKAHLASDRIWQTTDAVVSGLLPARPRQAHKYSVGMALVVGGAPGLTGAPVMASQAAARIGAGYVTCATRASLQSTLAAKLTEIATTGLPETVSGHLDVPAALSALSSRLQKASALLIGPGLGRDPATLAFVRRLVTTSPLPTVIDADGLNALAGTEFRLGGVADGRWILTPHEGEFRRLSNEDLTDRVGTVRTFARRWDSVLILKGMPSLVATPAGDVYICATGNPALATAGTGDVLAGLCVGLLAQGLTPVEAAVCAVHIGGAAADRFAAKMAIRSMMAMDMVRELPQLLAERFT